MTISEKIYPKITFELNNIEYLSFVIKTFANLSDEAILIINPSKTRMMSLDNQGIVLLEFTFPKESITFSEPRPNEKIIINLNDFYKALEILQDAETVSFERCAGTTNFIELKHENKRIAIRPKKHTKEEEEDLLDLSNIGIRIEYHCSFHMDKERLISILTESKITGSSCIDIKCEEESITFSSNGDMLILDETIDKKILSSEVLYEWKEYCWSAYNTVILLEFLENVKEITEDVKLSTRTDHPLEIKINDGELFFWIAPKVDDPDDYDEDEEDEF